MGEKDDKPDGSDKPTNVVAIGKAKETSTSGDAPPSSLPEYLREAGFRQMGPDAGRAMVAHLVTQIPALRDLRSRRTQGKQPPDGKSDGVVNLSDFRPKGRE